MRQTQRPSTRDPFPLQAGSPAEPPSMALLLLLPLPLPLLLLSMLLLVLRDVSGSASDAATNASTTVHPSAHTSEGSVLQDKRQAGADGAGLRRGRHAGGGIAVTSVDVLLGGTTHWRPSAVGPCRRGRLPAPRHPTREEICPRRLGCATGTGRSQRETDATPTYVPHSAPMPLSRKSRPLQRGAAAGCGGGVQQRGAAARCGGGRI